MAMSRLATIAASIAVLAATAAPALAQSWRDTSYSHGDYRQARYDNDRRDDNRRDWERRREVERRRELERRRDLRNDRRDWRDDRRRDDRRDWNDGRRNNGDVRGKDCVTKYDKNSGRWNQRCY